MTLFKNLLNTGLLTWIISLVIWQIASWCSNPDFLPGPYETLRGAIELSQDGSLLRYIYVSFARVFTGWLLGLALAIPIGLVMGRVTVVRVLAEPVLNFIRFIPPLAFITLFLLWFGIGEQSKIVLIIYATLFIVILNTMTGVLAVEEDKIRSARSMGASEWQILLHVIIPATVPHMFTGARLAMSTSYMAIIGAEMVAANEGVGYLIWNSRLYFKTDWIFVGLVALGLMGFLMDRLLGLFGSMALSRYGVTKGQVFRGKL
ncbi:ABC transporter permease [Paenibacillus sp. 481]|uniref:ABC transporter permease n=1 Tax=Paenibacillus sp. 481 TaxID=2835869 RepID=UPI001E35D696|nr:ABC transporter permease [Paenibacillus sp. 481]UHA72026.1 ABC transporter permease [Paenibacillus sp. 481]